MHKVFVIRVATGPLGVPPEIPRKPAIVSTVIIQVAVYSARYSVKSIQWPVAKSWIDLLILI